MTAWVVTGPAGSGKTTLGRALAERVGAVVLDLDVASEGLLDDLGDRLVPGGHWNDAAQAPWVRPARYGALLALAADQILPELVLIAPFTAELRGGAEWAALRRAVEPRAVRVLWLHGPADLLAERRAGRGLDRDLVADRPRHTALAQPPPAVPHRLVDARLPTAEQLAAVLDGD